MIEYVCTDAYKLRAVLSDFTGNTDVCNIHVLITVQHLYSLGFYFFYFILFFIYFILFYFILFYFYVIENFGNAWNSERALRLSTLFCFVDSDPHRLSFLGGKGGCWGV